MGKYFTKLYYLSYEITERNTVELKEAVFLCNIDRLVIPKEIEGRPVDSIQSYAFSSQTGPEQDDVFDCKELIIPDTIRYLGFSAFESARIHKINIPKSISVIPVSCFSGSLISEIVYEDISQIQEIEMAAFSETKITKFVWPPACSEIPEACFANSELSEISGIENVQRIGAKAFRGTRNLRSFVWPEGCEIIPPRCFCQSGIAEITGIQNIHGIQRSAFNRCTNLRSFEWPFNCSAVPRRCFYDSSIKEISGLESVVMIDKEAFASCPNLIEVKLGPNIRKIDIASFGGADDKVSVDVSDCDSIEIFSYEDYDKCNPELLTSKFKGAFDVEIYIV